MYKNIMFSIYVYKNINIKNTVNPLINAPNKCLGHLFKFFDLDGTSIWELIRRGRLFKNFISENRYYYKHETILHNINKIVIFSIFIKKIKAHIGIFNIRFKFIRGALK